jgi:hypothetical protein
VAVGTTNEKTDIKVPLTFENNQQGFVLMKGILTVPAANSDKLEELKVVAEVDQKNKSLTTGNAVIEKKLGNNIVSNNQAQVPIDKTDSVHKPYKGASKTLTLNINNLEVKELFDSGTWLDKQDPSLQIKIGKQVFSTNRYLLFFYLTFILIVYNRMKDAGIEAKFPEEFKVEIDVIAYNDNLEVKLIIITHQLVLFRNIFIDRGRGFQQSGFDRS